MPRKERREARTLGWWISLFPHAYTATLTLASPDPEVTGGWMVELRRGLARSWPDAALIYVTEPNRADGMFHVHTIILVDAPSVAVAERIAKLWRRHGTVKVDPVRDASDAAHYMLKRLADPATIGDHLRLNASRSNQRFRRSGPFWPTTYREVRSAYLDAHGMAPEAPPEHLDTSAVVTWKTPEGPGADLGVVQRDLDPPDLNEKKRPNAPAAAEPPAGKSAAAEPPESPEAIARAEALYCALLDRVRSEERKWGRGHSPFPGRWREALRSFQDFMANPEAQRRAERLEEMHQQYRREEQGHYNGIEEWGSEDFDQRYSPGRARDRY